jgi:hypothetical protein
MEAVAVATSVFRFIDFSAKLIVTFNQFQHGQPIEDFDYLVFTRNLKSLCAEISNSRDSFASSAPAIGVERPVRLVPCFAIF